MRWSDGTMILVFRMLSFKQAFSLSSFTLIQFSSVAQSCLTLCDPMNHSTPGLPVHYHLPEFTQTHVHRVGDAIQPSHPPSSPSPPAPNPSQHQSLFQWVNASHEVAKVLELFSSSSFSAIRVVSSAYLKLLIFLLQQYWFQVVIHPPPVFHMMYSA